MLFYTDIETEPDDDWKMVPDPKKIVDDIFIKKVESYMRWQQVQDAVVHHDGEETLDGIRRSKVHWMNNPEYQRQLTPIYKEVTTKVRALNDKYWRYVVDGWQAFQYTEYDESYEGYYDWHMDDGPKHLVDDYYQRKISFSLGLNDADEFEGGELVIKFGIDEQSYKLSKGEVLVFPSYLIHKVTPVTKGLRKVIVGWGVGPRI